MREEVEVAAAVEVEVVVDQVAAAAVVDQVAAAVVSPAAVVVPAVVVPAAVAADFRHSVSEYAAWPPAAGHQLLTWRWMWLLSWRWSRGGC